MVREKRLPQAAWMLQNTHKKISDIANEVGYENISFFNRIFVAMHGMSPRQYRQANKEKFFFSGSAGTHRVE
jgi:two-component system response regulator YesN